MYLKAKFVVAAARDAGPSISETPYFLDTLLLQEILSKYGVVESFHFNTFSESHGI